MHQRAPHRWHSRPQLFDVRVFTSAQIGKINGVVEIVRVVRAAVGRVTHQGNGCIAWVFCFDHVALYAVS